jgi:hypothetical protein
MPYLAAALICATLAICGTILALNGHVWMGFFLMLCAGSVPVRNPPK